MSKIKAISGFPEYLPEEQIEFDKIVDIIKKVYNSHGFVPLETPAVERTDVLLSKSSDDKEIYGLRRLAAKNDAGDKELGLRFDLTVPLARYVAQHYSDLTFPFKRYQIQPVWRGERAQAGRYRQFYQADIDIIGNEKLSLHHDAEVVAVVCEIFRRLKIGDFKVHLSNRKIVWGYLQGFGLDEAHVLKAIHIIDRLEKVHISETIQTLVDISGLKISDAEKVTDFLSLDFTTSEWIKKLNDMSVNDMFSEGVKELSTILETIQLFGYIEDVSINLNVTRGLDYYTGTVYETTLSGHEDLGSICSGGRYEDLASSFTNKKLPGVGISIGLSRLFGRLLQTGKVNTNLKSTAIAFVAITNPDRYKEYISIAATLRSGGINTEIFFDIDNLTKRVENIKAQEKDLERMKIKVDREKGKALNKQFLYAKNKGMVIAVSMDDIDFSQGTVSLTNLCEMRAYVDATSKVCGVRGKISKNNLPEGYRYDEKHNQLIIPEGMTQRCNKMDIVKIMEAHVLREGVSFIRDI